MPESSGVDLVGVEHGDDGAVVRVSPSWRWSPYLTDEPGKSRINTRTVVERLSEYC